MVKYTAIADVGETLIELLRDNMKNMVSPESIILISPGEVDAKDSLRISLFLYLVTENSHLKNLGMQRIDSNKARYPSMALDLFYMMTSYPSPGIQDKTERTKEEHSVLGRAMQVLSDNSILAGSVLRGSLVESGDELHISLTSLTIDEMTKIWSNFQGKPFRSSVYYLVTPVSIDSTREIGIQRVVSKETDHGMNMKNI